MGVKRERQPLPAQGFGAPLRSPAVLLQEAQRLAMAHNLLPAQALLDRLQEGQGSSPAFRLVQGFVGFQLGQPEWARTLLTPLCHRQDGLAPLACTFLADVLHHQGDALALDALLREHQAWARSPEGRLFAARLRAVQDPEEAVAGLLPLAEAPLPPPLRRMAGFDAVRLLDRLGRYSEAWALAERLQQQTAPPFDLPAYLARLEAQIESLRSFSNPGSVLAGPAGAQPPTDNPGLAFILGLPRSGTTLLEQMLDAHPAVRGLGEFQGVDAFAQALAGDGRLEALDRLPPQRLAALASGYRQAAQRVGGGSSPWWVEKSLVSWQWLPALARALPGSVFLHLRRDPRDLALSLSMAAIRPNATLGWIRSLEGIRAVIRLHRQLVPLALERLDLPHRVVDYEDLVRNPQATIQPCLEALQLPADPAVLHPEANPRTPITLSHSQVRQPIHDKAIGRWRHYPWLFDAGWEAMD